MAEKTSIGTSSAVHKAWGVGRKRGHAHRPFEPRVWVGPTRYDRAKTGSRLPRNLAKERGATKHGVVRAVGHVHVCNACPFSGE